MLGGDGIPECHEKCSTGTPPLEPEVLFAPAAKASHVATSDLGLHIHLCGANLRKAWLDCNVGAIRKCVGLTSG